MIGHNATSLKDPPKEFRARNGDMVGSILDLGYVDRMAYFTRCLVVIGTVLGVACSGSGSSGSKSTDGQMCDDAAATPSTDGPGFDCGPLHCSNDQQCVVLSCSPDAASCGPVYGCYDLPAACNGVASCGCLQATACHNWGVCTIAGSLMRCDCI